MPKKPTPKKTTSKPQRKSTKRRAGKENLKINILYTIIAILVVCMLIGFGYVLGMQNTQQERTTKKELSPTAMFDEINSTMKADEAGFGVIGMIDKLKKKKDSEISNEKKSAPYIIKGKKPKLVIIIDDVAKSSQLKTIKALPYHITPSIFPPSRNAPNSHKLARGLKHFMVHLPMESGSAKFNRMRGTLMTSDSTSKMQKRVRQIRKLFPNAKFTNNHTGSVFTSNYRALKLVYGMLKSEGFRFVDSKTSGKTKGRRVAKHYGDGYIVRDIFLDNTKSQSYIKRQLKKAIGIAKKRGYAIAIGHPYRATMRALATSQKLLDSVDVVYIDELY